MSLDKKLLRKVVGVPSLVLALSSCGGSGGNSNSDNLVDTTNPSVADKNYLEDSYGGLIDLGKKYFIRVGEDMDFCVATLYLIDESGIMRRSNSVNLINEEDGDFSLKLDKDLDLPWIDVVYRGDIVCKNSNSNNKVSYREVFNLNYK